MFDSFTSKRWSRETVRRIRDSHWEMMGHLRRAGVVRMCWWDKYRQPGGRNIIRHGLIDGMETLIWIESHRAWFGHGPYDRTSNTYPYWLTAAGRRGLRRRSRHDDLAPVKGGLVEPGWSARPAFRYHPPLWARLRDRQRGK